MARLRNFKLAHLIMVAVGIVFMLGAILNIALVTFIMRQQFLREAEAKAQLLLDRNMAVHTYFSQIMKPKLLEWTAPYRGKDYFEPSWMSSTYAVREIHNYFSSFNKLGYSVKDAAIDARSPENEADDFERAFLESLNRGGTPESRSEVRSIGGRPYLAVMRKGEVVEPSCLLCHGDPEKAPRGLVNLYGAERSFHRRAGDVASVVSMRIPLADAYAEGWRTTALLSILLTVSLGLLFGVQFFIYRRFFLSPLHAVRDKARAIAGSQERLGETIEISAGSEFGDLADAFNEMSRKLRIGMDHLEERVVERTRQIDTANAELKKEIAERKRFEEELRVSLREKETLLKEIHHRVKNNLQLISSLLGLQSGYLPDDRSLGIFRECQQRVSLMADIHTMLYQSADLARIDFGRFIDELAGRLRQSYETAGARIEIHVETAAPSLDIERSIPCGLILNELLSNALKHAFPDGRGGNIHVGMSRPGGHFLLTVRDDGIGFPAAVDFRNPVTLGLELVHLLVGQLNGTIDLQAEGGTLFTIAFPAENQRGRERWKRRGSSSSRMSGSLPGTLPGS